MSADAQDANSLYREMSEVAATVAVQGTDRFWKQDLLVFRFSGSRRSAGDCRVSSLYSCGTVFEIGYRLFGSVSFGAACVVVCCAKPWPSVQILKPSHT